MSQSLNRPYIAAVDHLRAMFAIQILFYHGWMHFSEGILHGAALDPKNWVKVGNPLLALVVEGHTGVAGFMVLSGFIFVHGAYGHKIQYGEFLRNRILRIYPVYLLLVVFALCLHPERDALPQIIRYLLPLANFGPQVNDYLPAGGWAVAVEFQFYLVFPFLLVLLERHGPGLFCRMILYLVFLRLLLVALGESVQSLSYWTIAGRMDQFLIGMLAGRWHALRSGSSPGVAWQLAPATISIVALLYAFNANGGWPADEGWKALWPTAEGLGWGWFILSYVAAAKYLPALMAGALSWIGQISFSIYMLHVPLIVALSTRHIVLRWSGDPFLDPLLTTALLAAPLTMGVAAFSYATVEAPFLKLRRRYLD